MIKKIYTDAGLISAGNSPHGGAFAAVFTDEANVEVKRHSGILIPTEIQCEYIEINLMETYAILVALESMEPGWSGEILCDNLNAKRRFSEPCPWGAVPLHIRERCHAAVKRAGRLNVTLLAGHPSPTELEAGQKARSSGNVYPCSIHNVHCDEMCKQEIKRWKAERASLTAPQEAATTQPPRSATLSAALGTTLPYCAS